MIHDNIKELIDKYCNGVEPTDAQRDEIYDMAFELGSNPHEVYEYMQEKKYNSLIDSLKVELNIGDKMTKEELKALNEALHRSIIAQRNAGRGKRQTRSEMLEERKKKQAVREAQIKAKEVAEREAKRKAQQKSEIILTEEWIESLPYYKFMLFHYLSIRADFGVKGNAMPFIEAVAEKLGYKVVEEYVTSIDDLRGAPIVYQTYFEYDSLWWQKEIDSNKDGTTLIVFNVDFAEDRVVNALKSFIENREENYFFCIITTDKNRQLERTSSYQYVSRVRWEEE